jgi:hypothetical protein
VDPYVRVSTEREENTRCERRGPEAEEGDSRKVETVIGALRDREHGADNERKEPADEEWKPHVLVDDGLGKDVERHVARRGSEVEGRTGRDALPIDDQAMILAHIENRVAGRGTDGVREAPRSMLHRHEAWTLDVKTNDPRSYPEDGGNVRRRRGQFGGGRRETPWRAAGGRCGRQVAIVCRVFRFVRSSGVRGQREHRSGQRNRESHAGRTLQATIRHLEHMEQGSYRAQLEADCGGCRVGLLAARETARPDRGRREATLPRSELGGGGAVVHRARFHRDLAQSPPKLNLEGLERAYGEVVRRVVAKTT